MAVAIRDFEIDLDKLKIQVKVKSTELHVVRLQKRNIKGQEVMYLIEGFPETSMLLCNTCLNLKTISYVIHQVTKMKKNKVILTNACTTFYKL